MCNNQQLGNISMLRQYIIRAKSCIKLNFRHLSREELRILHCRKEFYYKSTIFLVSAAEEGYDEVLKCLCYSK